MKTQRIISIGSTLTALTFLTLWVHERSLRFNPETEKPPIRELLRHVQTMERNHAILVADLNEKLHQTHAMLNETGMDLREKEKQIKDLRFGQAHNFISDERAMLLAGITGPSSDFQRLVSPRGRVHFEDASFSSETGGRLFFKTPKGRKGLYVTEIHPVIIRALEFDPLALMNAMQEDRLRRKQLQRDTWERVRESSEKTQQMMREKQQLEFEQEQERKKLQLEREEMQRQYDLAAQQQQESARRAREAERLRALQLQQDQQQMQMEAYRLYLYQQGRGIPNPGGLPVVPLRNFQNSNL